MNRESCIPERKIRSGPPCCRAGSYSRVGYEVSPRSLGSARLSHGAGLRRQNEAVDVISLSPRPPVRALALIAVATLLGALAVVGGEFFAWGRALTWVGVGFFAIAVLLLIAVVVAQVRNKVRVEVSDEGFTVHGPGGARSGTWDKVVRVSQSASGRRVTLHLRNGAVIHLVGQVEGVELAHLKDSIVTHLDAHRGYGPQVSEGKR